MGRRHSATSLIIDSLKLDTTSQEFQEMFPSILLSSGSKADYDPQFWKDRIQFQKYGSGVEAVGGLAMNFSISFLHDSISFLQYFSQIPNNRASYEIACSAFERLFGSMSKILHPIHQKYGPLDYDVFQAKEKPTDGRPDERYVQGALRSWGQGWIHLSEIYNGELVLEARIDPKRQ